MGYLLFAREVLNRYMMLKLLQTELEAAAAKTAAVEAANAKLADRALEE